MMHLSMNDLKSNMITLGVYCLEKLARAYFCCRRVCRIAQPVEMELTRHTPTYRIVPGDEVPGNIVLETWTSPTFKKSRVHYTGESIPYFPKCPSVNNVNPPWVWFGYKTPAEDMIDLTQDMSQFVVNGNVITPEFVHTVFPKARYGTVLYVDSESFETVELSSHGLVIGANDTHAPSPSCASSVSDSGEVCPVAETS